MFNLTGLAADISSSTQEFTGNALAEKERERGGIRAATDSSQIVYRVTKLHHCVRSRSDLAVGENAVPEFSAGGKSKLNESVTDFDLSRTRDRAVRRCDYMCL